MHLVQEEYVEIYCAKKKRDRQSIPIQDDYKEDILEEPILNQRQRLTLNLADSAERRYALRTQRNQNITNSLTKLDYQEIDEREAKTEFAIANDNWQKWEPN